MCLKIRIWPFFIHFVQLSASPIKIMMHIDFIAKNLYPIEWAMLTSTSVVMLTLFSVPASITYDKWLESVQDFLISLAMKCWIVLSQIIIFSLILIIKRGTKIYNRASEVRKKWGIQIKVIDIFIYKLVSNWNFKYISLNVLLFLLK